MNYCEKGVQYQLRASGIARRRTEPGWRAAVLDERASGAMQTERAEAFSLCNNGPSLKCKGYVVIEKGPCYRRAIGVLSRGH
jgi:hypothetical protein